MAAVRAYNSEFTRLSERVRESGIHVSSQTISRRAANSTMENASEDARNIVANANGNIVSLNNLTKSSKAAEIGMKAVCEIGNTLASSAASAAIDLVVTSVSEALQKTEKLKESSKNLTTEFNSSQVSFGNDIVSLSSLQTEYDELSQHVDSLGRKISGTNEEYERYKEIMSQIAAIMPEMGMRHDAHGNAISAMTGKVKDFTKEYEKIQQQKIFNMFNQKDENENNIYDIMENAEIESEDNSWIKEGKRISNDYKDMFETFMDGDIIGGIKKGISNSIFNGGGLGGFAHLYHLFNIFSDEQEGSINEQIGKLTEDIKSKKYQGTELGSAQNKLFQLQQQQKEQYDVWRTYASGYAQLYDPDNDGSSEFFDLSEDKQSFLSSFLGNMSPQFIEENNLTSQEAVTTFVSQWIDALGNEDGRINEAFNKLLEFNFDAKDMNPEEIRAAIDKLITDVLVAMKEAGMDVDTSDKGVASFKSSWGINFVDNNAENYKEKLNYFNIKELKNEQSIDENGDVQISTKEDVNKDRDQQLRKWASRYNVTESELDKLKNQGYGSSTEIEILSDALRSNREKQSTTKSFKQVWNSIGKSGNEEKDSTALEEQKRLEELAEAGKLTEKSLKNSSLAEIFKEAGISIEEATSRINRLKSSTEQLASMKTGISSISSILGEKRENLSSENTKKEGIGADTLNAMPEDIKAQKKEYENFVNVLGKGRSSMEKCQNAANKLASAYVNSNNFLANLTEGTKDYYTSVLEEMGVENASEIVHNKLIQSGKNLNVITKELGISKDELSNLTLEESSTLNGLSNASEEAKQSLYYYMLQKIQSNEISLATAADCQQLYNLAEQAGITKGELKELTNASIELNVVKGYQSKIDAINRGLDRAKDGKVTYTDPITAETITLSEKHAYSRVSTLTKKKNTAEKKANKNIDNFNKKNRDKIKAEISSNKKNTGNNTGNKENKSKSSKQQIDWIERRLKNLQDTIDFTAAKLQNLFNFQKKKSNLNDQIKTTTKLINSYGAAAAKYQKKADQIANPGKKKGRKLSKDIIQKVKSGKLNKKTKLSSLIKKYGEKDAEKIQSYIDYTDKARDARKNRQEQIAKKRNLEQNLYQLYVDRADGNISLYEQQKENAITAEKKNAILNNELKQYKESYQYQIKIAKLTKDTTEQARLRSEYEKKITDLRKEQLQNTLDENSDKNNLLEARLANAATAEDKNQILRDEIGIVHSDTAAYNKNYSDAVSDRSKQANASSESVKKDKSKKLTESDKKKIKNYISRNEPVPDKLINKCSPKTQEQLAKYNASLNWVEDALNKKNLNDEESKTKERELRIQQHENLAEQYQSDFDLLEAKKKNQTTAKEKNQTVDSQKSITSQIYNEKKQAARLEGNGAKEQQLQEELDREMVVFEKEKFDNIAHYYENLMKLKNNSYTDLTNAIDELEARGLIVGASLYSSQIQLNNEKKAGYEEELKSLEAQLPYIEEGTDEWYDAQDAIQSCKDGIADATRETIELNKAIREIPFLLNKKISTRLQLVSSEFELINKFMSNKKMFDDKTGNFTKEGTATLAAYYNQLLLAQEETKNAKTAADEMLAAIERGDEGYEDKELAMQEYYEKYDEYLKLAGTELDIQQKLIDMMKEKYQAELDYLKDIIDKRKDLLDTEKEAYDYQRSIEQKTKNIGSLAKQLEASKGDESEAGKLKLQQLQVSLDEARQDLQDTEYDKWISDQKEMLDKLYNEYSAFIDDKLNDTDALLKEAIEYLEDPSTKKDFLDTWDQYMTKHDFDPENDLTAVLEEIGKGGSIVSAINNLSNSIKYYYDMQQKLSDMTSNSATSGNSINGGNSDNAITNSAPSIQPPQEPAVDQNQTARDNVKNWIVGNKNNKNFWEQIKYKNASDTQKKIHDKIYDPGKGKRYMSATGMYALQKYLKVPNLLQYLTNIGYSSGGVVEKLQKVPGMNGDDGWATLKRGEAVLTPEQTKQFQKLAQNLDVLNSSVNILPNIQRQNSNFVPNHNTEQSIGEVNIQMEFPNVINYEEFRQKLQSDPKIENYVKSVIWDKGDLSKYKINM